MNIVQIIGTRPQYIKLTRFPGDFVIDTGQHYSEELCKDAPAVDLRLKWEGANATYKALVRLFKTELKPSVVVVYGDTFSTLVGAYAAKRCGIQYVHIEAGIRSGIRSYEERIRIKVDRLATYHFCVNESHAQNILSQNVHKIGTGQYYRAPYVVGDIMYEKFLQERVRLRTNVYLATLHRRENLKDLQKHLDNWGKIKGTIHFYVHPHTEQELQKCNIPDNVHIYDCISYHLVGKELDCVKGVFTDSGGLVREAYWSGVPCTFIGKNPWEFEVGQFGDGHTSEKIWDVLKKIL